MGANSQKKLDFSQLFIIELLKDVAGTFKDMVQSDGIEDVSDAIVFSNKEKPEDAKENEKIGEALKYQERLAEKRVMDVTPAFGDENSEQKLKYLQVETQKVEPKEMVERQKVYEQAIEEKQKIRRR